MLIIKLLFFSFIMLLGAVFTVLNSESVLFNYYFGSRELPLSLLIILALGCGLAIGVLSNIGMLLRLKQQNLVLKQKTRVVSEEVKNLRSIPLKD